MGFGIKRKGIFKRSLGVGKKYHERFTLGQIGDLRH
jgi:hypothetical protein